MSKKIVLIDGHSILNRAFYGVPDLSNAKGLHTNAILGFLNIMFKIVEEEKADYLTVAFDVNAPTFRHEIFKEYKGTRKPMPQELREQIPVMKEVLKAMGIFTIEQPGLEADDILGTIAKRTEKEGFEVSLVSGDRDLLQIASEHIKIRIPKTKGGKTEVVDYFAKDVEAEYQVNPIQFIELKALMGDASDNIPGVPKIGAKTATELMVQFGSLDSIYEHVNEITKKSIKESLIANKELADLSKVLATININGTINFNIKDAELGVLYTKEAYSLFKDLEFKNLLGRFEEKQEQSQVSKEFKVITTIKEMDIVFEKCQTSDHMGFQIFHEKAQQDGISCGMDGGQMCMEFSENKDFFGIAIAYSDKDVYWIPAQNNIKIEQLLLKISNLPQTKLVTFDIKKAYDFLGITNTKYLFDTSIAAYLINPLKNDYEVEEIANEYLRLNFSGRSELFGKADIIKAYEEKQNEFVEYACYCAYSAWKVMPILRKNLEETEMLSLFEEMEMPLSYVLYDMEKEGIELKPIELKAYGEDLLTRIHELEELIYEGAGEQFNINSPKQLGEILFEKLEMPGGKKTKTGYSTAAEVLEKLALEFPLVNDVLEYRGLAKLKSTYADGLANYLDENNRIHSTFNQTIAATGRISSTEPNLQNIPMKMELGRKIRKVFVPKDGFLFMDADYSQIELRLLAHMSADKQLIEAYRMDEDIHRITASKVFHTPFDEVTDFQRRNAKAVNFGIVYGISSFGLSQDLSIGIKEANEYIEQYFKTYPGVKIFLDKTVEVAKEQGYVTTMFGRRRPIPELKSTNFMQRSFGERIAMNSPIQGTAADVIKIAMIKVWQRLKDENLKSKMILQVHDELLIETAVDEVEQVRAILTEEMMHAANLEVSLEIDLHTGENWYESK